METEDTEMDNNVNNESIVDDKILRMMKIMGYQSGLGLGKNDQGIKEPVTVKAHFQREGFGLKPDNSQWDFSLEHTTPIESLEWLHNNSEINLNLDEMLSWFKEGKINIEEENYFADKTAQLEVFAAKNIFDNFDVRKLSLARSRANPFETIRSVFFMNRASMKIANIDAATDFMFTNINTNPLHENHPGPFYFADVCAGPGGFTEYILWRKKWLFKGFGFTLRAENDFKLTESVCCSPTTFLPLYGPNNDGNVCCPGNIDDFKEKVLFETKGLGVHFMMSDGGFSVEGQENLQEVLSKNIYVCQCAIALEILRTHGHFVTKLFDVFTRFSVGLLYLIYCCFEKVCILKPNSSRPANSERYFICYNYKGRDYSKNVRLYLRKIIDRLWNLKENPELDIIELVPMSALQSDNHFYSYIYNSNTRIARNQTKNLKKLETFCKNERLVDVRQDTFRKTCLEYWKIPDLPKVPLEETTESLQDDMIFAYPRIVTKQELTKALERHQDWNFTFLQSDRNKDLCHFYKGGAKVCRFRENKWVKAKNVHLTKGTLLFGELVKESYTSGSATHFKHSLHVIDAIQLGDLSLKDMNFEQRNNLIRIYCESVNHEFRSKAMRIRPKTIQKIDLCSIPEQANFIQSLPVLGYKVKEEFYDVHSVLFLKTSNGDRFQSTFISRMQMFIDQNEDSVESMDN